jgi:hypothetical protein
MAEKKVKTRIQQKHDIESNWIKATSFTPMAGEVIVYDAETSTTDLTGTNRTTPITYERFKIGDGRTLVTALPFTTNPHNHDDRYYTESEINTKVEALETAIAAKAPISHASSAVTYGVSTDKQFGHAMASSTTPKMDGTASVGSATSAFARGDHVHPTDTSRAASSHTHGNITNAGELGTASRIVVTDANKKVTTGSIDPANIVLNSDTRLTNARTPLAHTHTVADINDFPDKLPADGGNADTVDGKHASDFALASHGTHVTTETVKSALGTGSGTTKYLREDGTWVAPPNTDTKNTAGSTDTSNKLYLIGATSQATNPQTYSHDTAYVGTDGHLYSNNAKVLSQTYAPEAYLTWGGKNFSGGWGPIDAAMVPQFAANRFAFLPASAITSEYSTDGGSTWSITTASNARENIFATTGGFFIGNNNATGLDKSNYKCRITITTSGVVYSTLNKFAIRVSTNGSTGSHVKIESRTKANQDSGTNTWVTNVARAELSGWSGWNIINVSGITTHGNTSSQYSQLRFTFGVDTHPSTNKNNGLQILSIMAFGGEGWTTPSTMASNGHLYSYDAGKNATFPAKVTATQFIGSLDGAATSATKDSSGNTITTTYATKTELNDKISTSQKGAALGVAELGADGKVPSYQLPSYVDDVVEYSAKASFPATGESGKIYIETSTSKTWRWSGTQYVAISSSLTLGETSANAYRGDRGKIAYDHSLADHAPSDAEKNVQSDWNVTDTSSDAYIKNKPTIPTDTNTTYDLSAPTDKTNGNVTIDLTAGGSGSGTDSVSIKGSGATSVTTDANGVINISSTNNATTQTFDTSASDLRLLLSYSATDNTETAGVKKSSMLTFRPEYGELLVGLPTPVCEDDSDGDGIVDDSWLDDSNAGTGKLVVSGDIVAGGGSDSYGIVPARDNYSTIGRADLKWYQIYGTNIYGTNIHEGDTPLSSKYAPKSHASTATTYGESSATNYGHAKASSTAPKAPAETASIGSETSSFARGDHVHQAQAVVTIYTWEAND